MATYRLGSRTTTGGARTLQDAVQALQPLPLGSPPQRHGPDPDPPPPHSPPRCPWWIGFWGKQPPSPVSESVSGSTDGVGGGRFELTSADSDLLGATDQPPPIIRTAILVAWETLYFTSALYLTARSPRFYTTQGSILTCPKLE